MHPRNALHFANEKSLAATGRPGAHMVHAHVPRMGGREVALQRSWTGADLSSHATSCYQNV